MAIEKPTASLAELRQQREELFANLFESILEQTQLTPEQNTQIAELLGGALEKRDELADLVQVVEDEAERCRKIAKNATERAREYERFSGTLRDSIKLQLETLGVKKVEGLVHRFSLREGSNKVVVDDISALPPQYIRWVPEADKSEISSDLHKGVEVPGAHLEIAQKSLVIK